MSLLTSWYDKIPKHMLDDLGIVNKKTNIPLPALMCVVGRTGSAKTQWVLSFLHFSDNTWAKLILCTKNSSEPLYKFLLSKLKPDQVSVIDKLEDLPDVDTLQVKSPTIVIIDDMVHDLKKNENKVGPYFTRGRKKAVTTIIISQDFHSIPPIVRRNTTVVVLKRMSSLRDLRTIISNFALDVLPDQLLAMYRHCTKNLQDGLVIDLVKGTYMLNFTPLDPNLF